MTLVHDYMHDYMHVIMHDLCLLFFGHLYFQLVFTDRIRKRLYVTLDEGDTFDSYNINFTPDKLLFQKRRVSSVGSYEDHILGFDEGQKEVSTSLGNRD